MADNISSIADLDFSQVSPEEFARIVKGLSKREIEQLAADAGLRMRVLREVFARMERQFKPDVAGSLDALIRWKITGASEDAVFETHIANGTCAVSEGRSNAESRITLILADPEFLKLVSGNANPVTMFMTRKLKIAGDVGLAAGLTRYFDIPKA
ncbi:SCP2 sterol-binding domain-containing protein [Streptomyces sp. NPDC001941]|uniref:SCP2 sterol-binding domain-containing protein n=1 Tax=Streptomyces sp. NPDC001941 TaxID=3154659 RepID=UPI00331EE2B4